MKFVIDTDCLNFLLDNSIGITTLSKCEIIITESILHELGAKQQKILNRFDITIVKLTDTDIKYAGKLLHQISGRKEDKNNYLIGRKLSQIRNIGESEGGAIAKRLNIPIVLLDLKAFTTLKRVLKYSGISVYRLLDFGIYILERFGTPDQIIEFKTLIKKKMHLNC
ncbi:MAG: hypothetical protein ACTSWL_05645 [Promethearchaeota archaeon]